MTEPLINTRPTRPSIPARVLLGGVRLYQFLISPALHAVGGPTCGCRFTPTCSHYAADALRSHGALRGTWLAACRLIKCQPFHPGGHDPVPAARRRPVCESVNHGPTTLFNG